MPFADRCNEDIKLKKDFYERKSCYINYLSWTLINNSYQDIAEDAFLIVLIHIIELVLGSFCGKWVFEISVYGPSGGELHKLEKKKSEINIPQYEPNKLVQ